MKPLIWQRMGDNEVGIIITIIITIVIVVVVVGSRQIEPRVVFLPAKGPGTKKHGAKKMIQLGTGWGWGASNPFIPFLDGRNIYLVKNTPYCVLQSVSYSTTAAIVYAVSSVFFFFLVLFLFVVGLTPMTPCFRCTQSITQLLCL